MLIGWCCKLYCPAFSNIHWWPSLSWSKGYTLLEARLPGFTKSVWGCVDYEPFPVQKHMLRKRNNQTHGLDPRVLHEIDDFKSSNQCFQELQTLDQGYKLQTGFETSSSTMRPGLFFWIRTLTMLDELVENPCGLGHLVCGSNGNETAAWLVLCWISYSHPTTRKTRSDQARSVIVLSLHASLHTTRLSFPVLVGARYGLWHPAIQIDLPRAAITGKSLQL